MKIDLIRMLLKVWWVKAHEQRVNMFEGNIEEQVLHLDGGECVALMKVVMVLAIPIEDIMEKKEPMVSTMNYLSIFIVRKLDTLNKIVGTRKKT